VADDQLRNEGENLKRLLVFFSFLFFVGFSYASAPTVNFNYPLDSLAGVPYTFDPIISSTPDANKIMWKFGIDGNINFDSNQLIPILQVFDTFSDGDFTNNPTWIQDAGGWSAATNQLVTTTQDALLHLDLNLDLNWNADWNFVMYNVIGSGDFEIGFAANSLSSGIGIQVYDTNLYWCFNGVKTTSLGLFPANQDNNIYIALRDHNYHAYLNGVFLGSYSNNIFLNSSKFYVYNENSTSEKRFDKLYISDWNTYGYGSLDEDLNVVHSFRSAGVRNIVLCIINLDGTACRINSMDINGSIRMRFSDENAFFGLNPSLTVNGVSKTVSNYNYVFDLEPYSTDTNFVFLVSQTGKTERQIQVLDANHLEFWDYNLELLDSNLGSNIQFQFFQTDQITEYANKLIKARLNDGNVVGVITTDADGKLSFFLRPDTNYWFESPDINFFKIALTIQIPKDEVNNNTVSPFRLLGSGITSYDRNNLTNSVVEYLFPNAESFYQINVSKATGSGYSFSRNYYLRYRGNPLTASLTPYLVGDASGGFQSSIGIVDSYSETPLENLFVVSRTVTSNGLQNVESSKTDSTGKVIFSFVLGREYQLEIDTNELYPTFLRLVTLNAQSSTYYIAVEIQRFTPSDINFYSVDVNFWQSNLTPNDFGLIDLNWNLVLASHGNVSYIWKVYNKDGNLLVSESGTYSDINNLIVGKTISAVNDDENFFWYSFVWISYSRNPTIDWNFVKTYWIFPQGFNAPFSSWAGKVSNFGKIVSSFFVAFCIIAFYGFIIKFVHFRNAQFRDWSPLLVVFLMGLAMIWNLITFMNWAFVCLAGLVFIFSTKE